MLLPTAPVSLAVVNKDGVIVLPSKNAILLTCTLVPLGTIVTLRMFLPYVGGGFGLTVLPREGDELIALFPNGDIQTGVALWGMYNGVDKIPGANANLILVEGRPGDNIRLHVRGNVSIEIDGNEDTTIHGTETRIVDLDRDTTIGANDTRLVTKNDTHVVIENQAVTIGANKTETIGANETHTVGANRATTIGADDTTTITGNQTNTVVQNQLESTGINRTINVGANLTINVVGPCNINSAHAITLSAPLVNAALSGLGLRLCNEEFFHAVVNHRHPDTPKSDELQDLDTADNLTQILKAQ